MLEVDAISRPSLTECSGIIKAEVAMVGFNPAMASSGIFPEFPPSIIRSDIGTLSYIIEEDERRL